MCENGDSPVAPYMQIVLDDAQSFEIYINKYSVATLQVSHFPEHFDTLHDKRRSIFLPRTKKKKEAGSIGEQKPHITSWQRRTSKQVRQKGWSSARGTAQMDRRRAGSRELNLPRLWGAPASRRDLLSPLCPNQIYHRGRLCLHPQLASFQQESRWVLHWNQPRRPATLTVWDVS